MPAGDRKGPLGYGPATGRGAGFCTGNSVPVYDNSAYRCGRGRGFSGGGRGWRYKYYATGNRRWARGYNTSQTWSWNDGLTPNGNITPEKEIEVLKNQAEFFTRQIDVLNVRISELEEIASRNQKDEE
jgi:hypothetical protein